MTQSGAEALSPAPGGLTGKLFRGAAWLTAARLLITLVKTGATIVIAWFLSPEDYGIVAIAATVMVLLTSVTDMQLGEALIGTGQADSRAIDTVWTLGLLRGLALSLAMAGLALPLARVYDDPRLADILLVLSLQPALAGMASPQTFVQQRRLNFRFEFLLSVIQKLVGAAVMIALAVWLRNYWALIIGSVFEAALGALLSFVLLRYRPRLSLQALRDIWGFSLWMTLSQLLSTVNSRLDPLFIGKWLPVPQLGLFQLGQNLALMPTRELMLPIRKIAFPGLAAVLKSPEAAADPARVRCAYQRARALTNTVSLFVGICFALTADTLIAALFNAEWQDAVYIVRWLSVALALQTLGTLAHPLAMACGETRRLFWRDMVVLILRLPLILLALALYGLPGVVAARGLTTVLVLFVDLDLVRRLIGLGIGAQLRANLRPALGLCVVTLGVCGLKWAIGPVDSRALLIVQLAAELLLALGLYAGVLALLWRGAGRPDGPETELARMLAQLRNRRSPR